jgi:hypothetical protein
MLYHLIYQAAEAGAEIQHVEAVADPAPPERKPRAHDPASNPNTNRPYTPEDRAAILAAAEDDLPDLARRLGRSLDALHTQRSAARRKAEQS